MHSTNRKQVAHQLIDKLPRRRHLRRHDASSTNARAIRSGGLADSDADRVTDNKAVRAQYGLRGNKGVPEFISNHEGIPRISFAARMTRG